MSLFFRPSSSPGSFPEGDLTIGFRLRLCSDLQEKEMRTGVREFGVNSYMLNPGQKAGQTGEN